MMIKWIELIIEVPKCVLLHVLLLCARFVCVNSNEFMLNAHSFNISFFFLFAVRWNWKPNVGTQPMQEYNMQMFLKFYPFGMNHNSFRFALKIFTKCFFFSPSNIRWWLVLVRWKILSMNKYCYCYRNSKL